MNRLHATLATTALAALLLATPLAGQDGRTSADPAPAAAPADVESMDAIIGAVYDVISGPAGEKRDWDRFHSLFIDGARLIPTGRAPDGTVRHRVMTPGEYVASSGPMLEERGFFETEIGRVTERYGPVAHLFSSYESRQAADDPEPFARGINSFQLLHDGSRWWIVTIYWHGETAQDPIPEKYLGRTGG